MKDLLNNAEFELIQAPLDAGTGITNSASVDMQGFDSLAIVLIKGSGTSTIATVQTSSDDGASDDFTTMNVAGATFGGIDKLAIWDVGRPRKRFVRVNISRVTSSVIGGVIAIKYRSRIGNVVQGATVLQAISALSPGEA